jgi:hypothetical protein
MALAHGEITMEFDDNGWVIGAVAPMPVGEAWSLLSPAPEASIDAARWAHQAETFFRAGLTLVRAKRYPAGTLPISDAALVEIGPRADAVKARVRVITTPMERAPEAQRAAVEGARAIGGAGMDALIARARRLWQVQARLEGEGDPRAPLLLAAVLASLLLAPVVPPGGGTIFGVKGARERLAAAGWKT